MTVLYTDNGFSSISQEQSILSDAGATLLVSQCRSEEDVIAAGAMADALLVQWAPITRKVIEALPRCRHIVRIGIGVDNVDVKAASERGIAVSNVPDYCVSEVADHTVAMALALARQLPEIDDRLRGGTWKITPDRPMPAFDKMTWCTIGFGRIARAVQARAQPFGFRRTAFDPLVPDDEFDRMGVGRMSLDEAFRQADIVTLHCPLTVDTRHLVNAERLASMKSTSVLVNTSRGGLVDTIALAEALEGQVIGGAGIDVFEQEPVANDHPLLNCRRAIVTSHVAWYSEASVPELQRRAALEIARGIRGEALQNQINES